MSNRKSSKLRILVYKFKAKKKQITNKNLEHFEKFFKILYINF